MNKNTKQMIDGLMDAIRSIKNDTKANPRVIIIQRKDDGGLKTDIHHN